MWLDREHAWLQGRRGIGSSVHDQREGLWAHALHVRRNGLADAGHFASWGTRPGALAGRASAPS
jgi:hypothetical protein